MRKSLLQCFTRRFVRPALYKHHRVASQIYRAAERSLSVSVIGVAGETMSSSIFTITCDEAGQQRATSSRWISGSVRLDHARHGPFHVVKAGDARYRQLEIESTTSSRTSQARSVIKQIGLSPSIELVESNVRRQQVGRLVGDRNVGQEV